MADLIDLTEEKKAREETPLALFVCDCGCSTFYVRNDDELECAYCETIVRGAGYWKMPDCDDEPRETDESDPPVRNLIDVNDVEFARKLVTRQCGDEDVRAIVVLHKDGHINAWGDTKDGQKWRAWVSRKLREAADLLSERK